MTCQLHTTNPVFLRKNKTPTIINVYAIIISKFYNIKDKAATSYVAANKGERLFSFKNDYYAPAVGIEPTTNRLTGDCSTTELRRNDASKSGIRK